ncbi:MAG: o-succinylbenzoate--CoA ligase [Caldilineaceae bacterium]|nr:o-succinylbenzoate--CoA ligase [Caldilineaceae bacterium]
MQDWLAERAQITPGRAALFTQTESISYQTLNRRVAELCGRLAAAGVSPGDRVAALLTPGLFYATLVHAAARLQATLAPLNARLTHAEIARQLGRTRPRLLLVDEDFASIGSALSLPDLVIRRTDELPAGAPVWQPPCPWSLDATQAILFTSGTSGEPKGAQISFANHFWSAMASAERLGAEPEDRWLSCLPLYHVGGLAVLFRACLTGTAAILHPRFDVDAFHHAIDSQAVTGTSVVPTMLQRLLATRTAPWPQTLRTVLLGGAAAAPELMAEARRQALSVATTYGMTEACSQIATAPPALAQIKPGTAGKPLFPLAIRILNESGEELEAGEIGEIAVRGPTVMQGYLDDPAATRRVLPDGELRTGDMGYLDAEGDLWPVQRRSDLIISGGENIYPAEVENALAGHPAVARSCVVGLPHAEWGEQVAALVELHPDAQVTGDELLGYIKDRLASYKRPRIIRFTDALPQTASGKVARHAVSEIMRADL